MAYTIMKYYNNIKSLLCGSLFLMACLSFTSCKDWLDKDPDSIVAEDEAFKNYRNFQGYIEEIYNLIPDKQKINYCTSWNFGDDAVHNATTDGYAHMDHQVDLGNYRNWYTNSNCWLMVTETRFGKTHGTASVSVTWVLRISNRSSVQMKSATSCSDSCISSVHGGISS